MINFIGFLLPALIDMINRRVKDRDARFLISVAVCVSVGSFLVTLETNGFEMVGWITAAELIAMKSMAMFGMAQLSYKGAWEESSVRGSLGLNAKKKA